jgi:hypothetical protein
LSVPAEPETDPTFYRSPAEAAPDPRHPTLLRRIDATELGARAGYSRPHTVHCGPDGLFVSCLGGSNGSDGPGGIALLDHDTFDVVRAWETDRGPQYLAYDAWWHLQQNTLIISEWGTPSMVEVSRDGRRIYLTNSLSGAWDDQFCPDGVGAWLAKVDTDPDRGDGLRIDERFFPHGDDFRGWRVHQVRLQGGDASSDSYCFR